MYRRSDGNERQILSDVTNINTQNRVARFEQPDNGVKQIDTSAKDKPVADKRKTNATVVTLRTEKLQKASKPEYVNAL